MSNPLIKAKRIASGGLNQDAVRDKVGGVDTVVDEGIRSERTGPCVCRAPEIPFTGRIKSPEIYPRLAEPKHSASYVSVDETRAQMDSYTEPPAEQWSGGLVGKKKKEEK